VSWPVVQSRAQGGLSPFGYLDDVLLRAATHPHRLIGQSTPRARAETSGRPAAA